MKLSIFFLFIFSLVFFSCDSTLNPISEVYTGITQTGPDSPDPIGDIDFNDWKPITDFNVTVYPAYPNPTYATVTLQYTVPQTTQVRIYFNDPTEIGEKTLINSLQESGIYSINIDLSAKKKSGFVRVFIEITKESITKSTYGDILYLI